MQHAPALSALAGLVAALAVSAAEPAAGAPSAGPALQKSKQKAAPFLPVNQLLRDALALAPERNLPVVLFVTLEGEPQNDAFRDTYMDSSALAERAQDFLGLVANDGVHERVPTEVGQDAEGEPIMVELCAKYRTDTCKLHQTNMDLAWASYAVEGELKCPTVLVLAPDGKLLARLGNGEPAAIDRILTSVDEVAKEYGKGLSEDELARVRGQLIEAERAAGAGQWGASWRAAQAVLEVTTIERYAQPARARAEAALPAMAAQIEAALAKLATEGAVPAYTSLLALGQGLAGTPAEEDWKKAVNKLEKGKETRDAIKAFQREREAGELLEQARALFRDGETSKAEARIKTLLRKFADTEAGRRAAEDYPGLVDG